MKAIDDPKLREITEQLEHAKASIRAAVEHPFRVLKRQFGYEKMRYKGLVKNGAQVTTLFALVNLWMALRSDEACSVLRLESLNLVGSI